jgi:hypothetical protein
MLVAILDKIWEQDGKYGKHVSYVTSELPGEYRRGIRRPLHHFLNQYVVLIFTSLPDTSLQCLSLFTSTEQFVLHILRFPPKPTWRNASTISNLCASH